jgi:long-subunit fatty acid transport protein
MDLYSAAVAKRRVRERAAIVVAALMLLAGVHVATAPQADAFAWRTGSASLGCDGITNSADSAAHGYWYLSSLSAAMATATNSARANYVDPTDITTFNAPSLASDTDVVVTDQDYTDFCGKAWHGSGGVVIGQAMCVSLAVNPANACEKHEVRYDESYVASASGLQRISMACHENGHTLGLTHPPNNDGSCMWFMASSQGGYSVADITNINLYYN